MRFEPAGLITLTTDFGLQDPFVGCMKGVLAARAPQARVVDLTHGIPPQDIDAAGFWLSRSFAYFPEGTVHLAVVDPGVGGDRDILLVTTGGHCLLAPDNGLLAPLLHPSEAEARVVSVATIERFSLVPRSLTFHGRDIFAPLACAIATGELDPREAGPLAHAPAPGGVNPVILSPGQVQGEVVLADRFGNLITNIDASMLGDESRLELWAGGQCMEFRHTYSDARPGELMALINSFGVVEIACSDGSAATRLGLGKGALVQISRTG